MNYVLQPLVNQVDQLTHQVDDVTTDQLMTTLLASNKDFHSRKMFLEHKGVRMHAN